MIREYRGPIIFAAIAGLFITCLGAYALKNCRSGQSLALHPAETLAPKHPVQPPAPLVIPAARHLAPNQPLQMPDLLLIPALRPSPAPLPAPVRIETLPNSATSTTHHKAEGESNANLTVYVTRTGEKYHRLGCRYLSQSSIPMSLGDALGRYTPCSVCGPPLFTGDPTTALRSDHLQPPAGKPYVAENGSRYGEMSKETGKPKTTYVRGYTRKDGTYVRSHYRSK
jgi:hypothetical protein